MNDYEHIQIESSLPKPWEQEETFNDVLYDWMSRAPWLAISAAAHGVIFLIIQAIPWNLFNQDDGVELQASTEAPPPEQFEDPPPEEEEEIEEEETEEDMSWENLLLELYRDTLDRIFEHFQIVRCIEDTLTQSYR